MKSCVLSELNFGGEKSLNLVISSLVYLSALNTRSYTPL